MTDQEPESTFERGASGPESPRRKADDAAAAVVPEAIRRLLEAGLERLGDRPEQIKQRLSELKLPREAWMALLSQLDDRKSGLYRLVTKEVRDFLQETNFAEDLVRALTTLSFEIKTEVRFIPNDAGKPKPNVRARVKVNTAEESSPSSSEQEPKAP